MRLLPEVRRAWIAVTVGWFVVVAFGCESADSSPRTPAASSQTAGSVAPPKGAPPEAAPGDCRRLSPEADLQAAIDEAEVGASICLEPGRHEGPLLIEKPLTIWGPEEARLASEGEDSTVRIGADGVELRGFTIEGSGRRYTKQDAGVFLQGSDDVVLEGLTMRDVLFGVSAQTANRLTIRGLDIRCRGERELGMRGDGIRFWEVRRSRVVDNRIRRCRDLVVWYSPENYFARNRVTDGRYGMHFMYSSRNIVEESQFLRNSVGIFLMYSRHVHIEGNLLGASGGSSGTGLGLKESGALQILQNEFFDNTEAVYVDNTPLDPSNGVLFALNRVRMNGVGMLFHNEPKRTTIRRNTFRSNGELIGIQGGGTADTADWNENYFGRYAGYDFDRNGTGDVDFEYRSFTQTLQGKHPTLEFLKGTPAMHLAELATEVVPLYQPTLLLSDSEPLMQPPTAETSAENREELLETYGEFPIREGDVVPLVAPPDTSLSKEY